MFAGILFIIICCLTIQPFGQSQKAGLTPLPAIDAGKFGPGIREQLKKAIEDARRNTDDPAIVGRLAMTLHAYQEYHLAATVYERAGQLEKDEFKWMYLQGICQAALGRNADAVKSFETALARRPDYLLGRLRLAETLLAANRLEESRGHYQAVIAGQPESPEAHYGLGRVKANQGDSDGAIASLVKACELAPNWGSAHYALALAYRNSGRGEEGKISEHLELYQRNRLVRSLPVDSVLDAVAELNNGSFERLKRGVQLEAEGKLDESIAEHEGALEINPQLIQAHLNLIQLYARTSQTAKAEQRYRSTIAFNPNLAEAHYNIGVMYLNQKRYAEAARAFRLAVDSNPQYAEAHLNYGLLLEQEQKYDEALEHYRLAVEHRPNLREAHFQMARMLIYKNLMPEAIEHLKLTLTPEDDQTPRYTYALGAAYARAGDRASAIRFTRLARDKAAALNQTELLERIERDLKNLEK